MESRQKHGLHRSMKVGLLGGSFNPAHEGHRHISLEAIKLLELDEVWWIVSPQNPLKSSDDMGGFDERVSKAAEIANHLKIKVTDIEKKIKTRYTADTLQKLKKLYPETKFVWLMGADNLLQIPNWKNWENIFNTVSIAVFDRSPYCYKALNGKAARRFAHARIKESRAKELLNKKPPVWSFIHIKRHSASSTEIRAKRREL
ncbi:MAG: nicotinate-nucleotide adenylyltransferase [Alphaproteobacteria bacterium]|nr:nicotinate-nucleotide adenylyltransferase [Alphaproteobacteria bacterium]